MDIIYSDVCKHCGAMHEIISDESYTGKYVMGNVWECLTCGKDNLTEDRGFKNEIRNIQC